MKLIEESKASVWLQAYSFTSESIAAALIRAHSRGIVVRVLVDASNDHDPHSRAQELAERGVEVWVDAAHPIAHNKVMIVDGEVVETGSYNFTKQAETSNAENVLILRDRELARQYASNWESHQRHARLLGAPLAPREGRSR